MFFLSLGAFSFFPFLSLSLSPFRSLTHTLCIFLLFQCWGYSDTLFNIYSIYKGTLIYQFVHICVGRGDRHRMPRTFQGRTFYISHIRQGNRNISTIVDTSAFINNICKSKLNNERQYSSFVCAHQYTSFVMGLFFFLYFSIKLSLFLVYSRVYTVNIIIQIDHLFQIRCVRLNKRYMKRMVLGGASCHLRIVSDTAISNNPMWRFIIRTIFMSSLSHGRSSNRKLVDIFHLTIYFVFCPVQRNMCVCVCVYCEE